MARLVDEVLEWLATERAQILAGDFDQMSDQSDLRERLLKRLDRAAPSQSQIETIRAAARRNADLIKAALKGVSAAKSRLADIDATKKDFGGYDARGGRFGGSISSSSLDCRA